MDSPRGMTSPGNSPTQQLLVQAALGGNANGVPAGGGAEELLKEQHKERERLLKENFNMKLRLDFLEDQLLRYKKGNAFEDEDSASENVRLKMLLEEKQEELTQRNYSMVRATEAIGLLQKEIADWKQKYDETNQQLAQTAQQNESLKDQLQQLQQQLQQMEFDQKLMQNNLEQSMHNELLQRQQQEESQQHNWQQLLQQKDQEIQLLKQQFDKEMDLERQQFETSKQTALEALQRDHQQQIESANLEKHEMEENLSNISQKIEEFEREYFHLRQESDKMRHANAALQQENESLRKQSQQLANQAQRFQHDQSRVASDVDKISQEKDKLTQALENVRKENVSLHSQVVFAQQKLEHSDQSIEKLEAQKRKLEDECVEARRANQACEFEIHKLQSQVQMAEKRCTELNAQLREVEAQKTQLVNQDRVQELEKEKYRLDEELFRLRNEISLLHNDLELAQKNARANEQFAQEESAKAKEYREKMLQMESELLKKDALVDQLETRVTDLASNRQNESARSLMQANEVERIAEDRKNLRDALEKQRMQAETRERHVKELQQNEATLKRELHETEQELGRLLHVNITPREMPLGLVVRRAFQMLQSQFEDKATRLENQWKHNATMFQSQLESMMERLNNGHKKLSKLDLVMNNTMHSQREARSLEQAWTQRLQQVHDEYEAERRMMEEKLQMERLRKENAENALAQAKEDLNNVISSRNDSLNKSDAEFHRVKESNRLLVLELEERRKTLEQVRKQTSQVVQENTELLQVIRQLREHISEQDRQLQRDQTKLQLHQQQRGSEQITRKSGRAQIRDAKDSILFQLDETQRIIRSACKRLESGGFLVKGQELAEVNNQMIGKQVEEWMKRLEQISSRARELAKESGRFQDKYADTWRLQVKLSGLQRGGDSNSDWIRRVGDECHKLLAENRELMESIGRISKAMQKFITSRQVASEQFNALRSPSNNKTLSGPEQDDELERDLRSLRSPESNNIHKQSWSMDTAGLAQSSSSRRGGAEDTKEMDTGRCIYKGSLSSLDRIGENLQEIERKIRSYRE